MGSRTTSKNVKSENVMQVTLKGTKSERTGAHSVFHADGLVHFQDGIAYVTPELADQLRSEGVVK